jgi:hypothetical protein
LGGDLDAKLVNVSLKLSLFAVFRFKLFLNLSDLSMKLLLLVIELLDLLP